MMATVTVKKMVYKRKDGRKATDTRKIIAKAGVIKNADGSAFFQIGNTSAYAAVYGPREMHPKFMQNPKKGVLRVNYNMLPFSGMGDRVRPGPNRRSKEIGLVSTNALEPVLDLTNYPNSAVDVYIELPQTDAGSRCAGICAASIALADAGLTMKDMVVAIGFGKAEGDMIVDLDYDDEQAEGAADIPVAIIPSTGEITLLQCDGEISPKELTEGLKMIQPVIEKIAQVQRDALRAKFKKGDTE